MPTYEYRCADCGHDFEAVQSFSEAALTECPQCGRPALRKVFGNVGVVFKGSGFYRNDSRNESRKAASAAAAKSTTDKDKGATGSNGSGKDEKTAATPAKPQSAESAPKPAAKPAPATGPKSD